MSQWWNILFVIAAALLAWWGFRTVKNNPALFSKVNFGKTAQTLGVLALLLIGFIGLLVLLLKH